VIVSWIDINDFSWPEMTSRLANAHIARLAYETLDGPRVVLIAVTGDRQGRIVFRTNDDPDLADLDARAVAVEVDGGTDAIEHHWFVTTVGTARDVTGSPAFATLRADHRRRHPHASGRWIVVEPRTLTGRRDRGVVANQGWFAGVPGS
jgi:hypothetical protein